MLFLAGYLAENRELISVFTVRVGRFRLPDAETLLPLLAMWAISFAVVALEKDLGSALVLFVLFITMLYVASGEKSMYRMAAPMAAAPKPMTPSMTVGPEIVTSQPAPPTTSRNAASSSALTTSRRRV